MVKIFSCLASYFPVIKRRFFLSSLLTIFLCAGASISALASEADIRFVEAEKTFITGDTDNALSQLEQVLKKYPSHQPSLLLKARILYRQSRLNEAANIFYKVDLGTLDSDASFEYAVAMYSIKKCLPALRGFVRVPQNHPNIVYARFYSGTCYLQRNENTKALIKFRKAEGLPFMLDSLRRQLIRIAEKRIVDERRGVSTPLAQMDYLVPLASQSPQGHADKAKEKDRKDKKDREGEKDKDAGASKKPQEAKIETGLKTDITPSMEASYTDTQNSYSGMVEERLEKTVTTGGISLNTRYNSLPFSNGGQSYVMLSLLGQQTDENYVVTKNSVVKTTETNFETGAKQTTGNEHYAYNNVKATPTLGLPLGKSSSLLFLTEYERKWGRFRNEGARTFETTKPGVGLDSTVAGVDVDLGVSHTIAKKDPTDPHVKYGNGASGGLSKTWSLLTASVKGSITNWYLPKNSPLPNAIPQTEKTFTGAVTIPNEKLFNINGSVNYRGLDPAQQYVNWDKLEEIRYKGSIDRGFDFGLTLTISGEYATFENFVIEGLAVGDQFVDPATAPTRVGAANGTDMNGTAGAKLTLFDFLNLGASYTYDNTEYAFADPQIRAAFLKNVPSIASWYVLSIGVSKTF
ncbi:MAG: tetratricopeptide repeat protein [Oligoflexales bacterium]|nr:tetratricopeptide repeat protein [Oligoflexales bacterium]